MLKYSIKKLNIQPEHCKFFVNKEQGVVVCTYDVNPWVVLDYCNDQMPAFSILCERKYRHLMPSRFTGKARCSKDDVWDEQTGRNLAFVRMKHKYMLSFFRCATKILAVMDKDLNELTDNINYFGEIGGKDIERYKEKLGNLLK